MIANSLLLTAGCGSSLKELRTPARFEQGYVILLPGVEGKSHLNKNIAKGLADGGVRSAIEVYDWTIGPSWLSAVVNLRASSHNRLEARKIGERIIRYQNKYPGRPVHLVGHSGGGGVAVYALESLPPRRQITAALLLAPALSPDYDLRPALRHVEVGIYNFYSPYDVGFLKLGTSTFGTIDGRHTRAAGAVGFETPWGLDRDDRQLYAERLHQQRYLSRMAQSGHPGTHVGWANRRFVAEWLAPLVLSQASQPASMTSPQLGGS
jgi:pimeloyl-ACP methyl ester carboxylesterase